MKKLLCILLSAIMILSLFAGCGAEKVPEAQTGNNEAGNNEAGGKQIKILMHNSWDDSFPIAMEAFEKETGIKVVADFYAFEDVLDAIEIVIGSKSSEYDVIAVDGPQIAAYANRGYLEPLSNHFTEDEINVYTNALIAQGTWDGKFYGAPLGDSGDLLFYNTALLEEAGMDIDWSQYTFENRITWEELEQLAAEAVSKLDPDGSRGIFGLEFQQVSAVYEMNVLANSMGGKNIGDDGFSVDGVINDNAWIKALTWYQNLVTSGLSSRGVASWDETNEFFGAGKTVFMMGGSATKDLAAASGLNDVGYTYLPCFAGYEDQVATNCGSWAMGINAYSENKEAAAEFIKYMTQGAGYPVFLEMESAVPNAPSAWSDEIVEANPVLEIVKEQASQAVARAVTPGFSEYSTSMNALWENVRNGMDIQEALNTAIDEINTAMKTYQ